MHDLLQRISSLGHDVRKHAPLCNISGLHVHPVVNTLSSAQGECKAAQWERQESKGITAATSSLPSLSSEVKDARDRMGCVTGPEAFSAWWLGPVGTVHMARPVAPRDRQPSGQEAHRQRPQAATGCRAVRHGHNACGQSPVPGHEELPVPALGHDLPRRQHVVSAKVWSPAPWEADGVAICHAGIPAQSQAFSTNTSYCLEPGF